DPEIHEGVPRNLDRIRERLGGIGEHALVAALPIDVILGCIDGGEPLMPRELTGTGREIHLIGVFPRGAHVLAKPSFARKIEFPRTRDRWPGICFPPNLPMHAEVMNWRLVLQTGVKAHQVVVEKAKHFREDVEFRLYFVAPERDVCPRAVVPRAKQQMLLRIWKGQVSCNGAVCKPCTIHPS